MRMDKIELAKYILQEARKIVLSEDAQLTLPPAKPVQTQPAAAPVQQPAPVVLPANSTQPQQKKRKKVKVNFDKATTPWQVEFSERGFLIGETRLSFENIEDALNKKYNIVLDNGGGMVLDAVKIQKILKYKEFS